MSSSVALPVALLPSSSTVITNTSPNAFVPPVIASMWYSSNSNLTISFTKDCIAFNAASTGPTPV